jgi:hypothetical protein
VNNSELSHKKQIHDTRDIRKFDKQFDSRIKNPSIESTSPYKPVGKYSHKEDVKKKINFAYDSVADKENTNHDNSQRDPEMINKFLNFDTPMDSNRNPSDNNITNQLFNEDGTSNSNFGFGINKIFVPNKDLQFLESKTKFDIGAKTRNINDIVNLEIPEFTDMKYQNGFTESYSDSLVINRLVPSQISGVSKSAENMKFDIFRDHETPN